MIASNSHIAEAIRDIADEFHITLAVLFGSHATNIQHVNSDIDIALHGDARIEPMNLAKLSISLEKELRAKVDVLDIFAASPTILQQVAQNGIPVYEREPAAFSAFRIYARNVYIETKPLRDIRRKALERFTHVAV